jgi:hypothetical protein
MFLSLTSHPASSLAETERSGWEAIPCPGVTWLDPMPSAKSAKVGFSRDGQLRAENYIPEGRFT